MPSSAPNRADITRRIPVKIRTMFTGGTGLLQNVSTTGAYVATPMALLPHARVRLQIVLREERRWVEADAIVVWENRGKSGGQRPSLPGYGLRFISVPDDTRRLIDEILRGTLPMPASELPRSFAPRPTTPPPPASNPELEFSLEGEREGPPFRLHAPHVESHAPERRPGIYVLSYTRTQEARVGRADEDLRATIRSYEGEYAYFWCEIIDDASERFERECDLFHSLGGDNGQLDNDYHPYSDDFRITCPHCRES